MTRHNEALARILLSFFYFLLSVLSVIKVFIADFTNVFQIVVVSFSICSLLFLLFFNVGNRFKYTKVAYIQEIFWLLISLLLAHLYSNIIIFVYISIIACYLFFIYLNKRIYSTYCIIVLTVLAICPISYYLFDLRWQKLYFLHYFSVVLLVIIMLLLNSFMNFYIKKERDTVENERSMDDLLTILNIKCEEARVGVKSKSDFLSNMSHEIRTPINSVLGMNEMILRETDDEAIREYALNVDNAGRVLLSLINDILDFSKIDSGNMEIIKEKYQSSSLLIDLVAMFEFQYKKKHLDFIYEIDENIPSVLYGDVVRIRQIVTNLLSNALKYTKEGSVTFRVKCEKNKTGSAFISYEVEDTGIGIKEESLAALFVAFQRIDEKKNRDIQGTGLGLNIAYKMLEKMGSELKVQSEYGKGSKFYFVLEQDVADYAPIGKIDPSKHKFNEQTQKYKAMLYAPKARALVVDDNEMNRKVFSNLLKKTKIQIDQASGGQACIDLMKQNHYDIVFLDHMMPEMDGIETINILRKEVYGRNSVIIALTANAVAGARELYLQNGFNDFLSKPIMPNKLERMILDYLPDNLLEMPEEDINDKKTSNIAEVDLPIVDGIDWMYAMTHFPEQQMLVSSIKDFYLRIDPEADALEAFYNDQNKENWNDYKIAVHGMKSAAALIGAFTLSGCAKVLEDAAKDNNEEIINRLSPIFINEWRSFKVRLRELDFIGNTNNTNLKEDNQIVLALLNMLVNSSEDMDIDAMDEDVEELSKFKLPDECFEDFEALKGAVVGLEIDRIKELCENISQRVRENLA